MSKKNHLEVTITNYGFFYKAKLNGVKITKEELFEITGEPSRGMRLDAYLDEFKHVNYHISQSEKDVS